MTDRWREAVSAAGEAHARESAAESEERRGAQLRRDAAIAADTNTLRLLAEQLEAVHAALDRAGWPQAKTWRQGFVSYRALTRTLPSQRSIDIYVKDLGKSNPGPSAEGGGHPYQFITFMKQRSAYGGEQIDVACVGTYCGPLKGPISIGRVRFRDFPPVELTPDMILRAVAAWAAESDVSLDL